MGSAAFLATPVFRPVIAEAQSGPAPKRLLVIVFPGGVRYNGQHAGDEWWDSTNHNFKFEKVLSPLVPLRSDIAVMEGIGDASRPGGDAGHVQQTLLTGDVRLGEEENHAVPPGTTSLDQRIADHIGQGTRFRSLQLGVDTEGDELTHKRIVFRDGSRIAPVNDPRMVFARVFADLAPAGNAAPAERDAQTLAAMERQLRRKQSIFDLRKRELAAIRNLASRAEHAKLDEHLTAVRELELQLAALSPGLGGAGAMPAPGCQAPRLSNDQTFRGVMSAMSELAFQALNCDLTRVVTLQWLDSIHAVEGTFSFLGTNRAHHPMQHEWADDYDAAQTWFMSQAAAMITRFKQTPDGAGGSSLLDNSAIWVVSEQAFGDHWSSPTMGFVAGRAGGAIRTGAPIRGNRSTLNEFLVGLGRAFGLPINTFGTASLVRQPLALG